MFPLPVLILGALFAFVIALASLQGCTAARAACIVINAASDECHLLAVPAPDGGTMNVPVSGAELRAFAHERAMAHAQQDGGQ